MTHLLGSRYVLHELLGCGSVGQVFRGSTRADGSPVAVKVLRPELICDPEVIARFVQERSILISVSHPHVVRVLDLVVEGDTAGIVMELVRGQDLRQHLPGWRTLQPAHAVELTRQMLAGAAAVHAAGIVHRDLKPENVLVDTSGKEVILKLTDFGIARLSYAPGLTRQPSLLGTPEYIAPEVADAAPATPAADLYSIGIVLYEMLAGRTPFAGGHPLAVLHRQVEQLAEPIPGIRADLWALVEWLLAKDPQSRPSSAVEAAAALARLPELAGEPALPAMAPLPAMTGPPMTPAPARSSMAMSALTTGSSPYPAPSGDYPQPADPADLDHPATVLSHLYRQDHPDRYPPTADWVRYAPPPPPGMPAVPAPEPSRSRRKPRLALAVGAAVMVVLATVVGLVLRHPSPRSAAAVPAAVSYTFAPQEYPDGLLIVRRWSLGGEHGSMLTEKVSAISATGRALRVPFRDEIPEAVARTTRTVVFTPAPAKIVKADPVVEWLLPLPSHGAVQVGYDATVPALGATRARLMGLVRDFDALQTATPGASRPDTIQLTSLAIEPGAVRLEPGKSIQLELTGRLSNGYAAPQAVLSSATWSTANPAVASITSAGTVTGVSADRTYVTAQIGSAQASVPVTVAAAPSQADTEPAGPGPAKVTHTAVVPGPKAQKILFTSAPPPSPVVGATYDVAASGGGSGNPVTFTIDSSSTSICSVSGSTVTFSQPGGCVIDANQPGSVKYQPAPQAQQAITVVKARQTIRLTVLGPGSAGGSATLSATGGGSGNPVVFSMDTSSGTGVCTVSGTTVSYHAAGSCVIDANQVGNAAYQPAPQAQQTITVSNPLPGNLPTKT